MAFFIYDGRLFNEGEPVIGADSRGLRYGDGLFETMRLVNRKLVFEEAHFERLLGGMRSLQFYIPENFDRQVKEQAIELAIKNDHAERARVRLTILRGNGHLHDVHEHVPHYIIQTWELPEATLSLNTTGLTLGVYTGATKCCDALSNIKHNNYLPYVMAALHAGKNKWDDAVLLNNHGRICDSTIANIFFVKNEKLFTPSLTEGCVAGVTRRQVIMALEKTGWSMQETEVSADDLGNADEVFLTNSIYTIRWVQRFSGKIYTNTVTRKIYTAVTATIL